MTINYNQFRSYVSPITRSLCTTTTQYENFKFTLEGKTKVLFVTDNTFEVPDLTTKQAKG